MILVAKVLVSVFVAFVVIGMLTIYRANQRSDAAQLAFPPTGQFVEVDGVRIHARVEGSGPDLVLIHGASGSTRDMAFEILPALTDRYRVIVFDRPGLGYSDRADPRYARAFTTLAESPQEQADILQKAAAKLGADKPIVLGHSFGGAVALAWATYHPDNIAALIDVAGVAMPWPGELDILYRINGTALGGGLLVPFISAYTPDAYVGRAIEGLFAPDPAPKGYAETVGAPLTLRRHSFRANARQVNTLRPHVVAMQNDYDRLLDLPIEILHGTADTTVPIHIHSRPLAERLANARLTEIEGGGHMIHHTHTAEVVAAIDRSAIAAGLR